MSRNKRIKIIIITVAVLAVLSLGAFALYRYIAPSSEKKELNSFFKTKSDTVALIIDDEKLEQYGKKIENEIYVPAEIATTYMDKRIYVDETAGVLSYATTKGLIVAETDKSTYMLGKQQQTSEKPILRQIDKIFMVSFHFIEEHTSCYYKLYTEPSRLIVMSNRDTDYTFATLTSDTRVRTGPGKKYPYLTEVTKESRVFVETEVKQENDYIAITTFDGVYGYIPKERMAKEEKAKWKFEKTPESFTQQKVEGTLCLGWHQVTNEAGSSTLPASVNQAEELNILCPTWYALSDNSGNFTSYASTSYVTQAHEKGLKVWALVNDFQVGKGVKLSKVLGVTANRTKLVNRLVASAITHNLDGINVDFEKVTQDTASAYLQFLRELTLKCHANDLVVSVDNYTPAQYNRYYDLEEQGRIVDYVILMAYDEHYQGGEEAGSVSSFSFVKSGVEAVLSKVPKERMVTALPFYTRLWKVVKGKKPTSEAYGMSGAESVVRANDATPKWDEKTGQYYAQFKSGSATYKIWLEEETSLCKKLEVVCQNECAGVAFWKLGFERAVTWTTIKDVMKK